MAYTTKALVQSMFRNLAVEATGTVVIDSEMTQFIEDADAEIDAKLGQYYVTPITGTESLKIVGVISRYKAAHVIKTILEVNEQRSDNETQDVQTNLDIKANRLLADLLPKFNRTSKRYDKPAMPLPDAEALGMPPESATLFSTQTTSETVPTFTKGGDNW